MGTKKDSELFNRYDLETVVETTKQVNVIMQRIGKYLTGEEITTTISTIRRGQKVKHIVPLKHYDLDKTIKFFESIENLDARKHAKASRKKILGFLRVIKEERIEALNKKKGDEDENN